MKLMTIALLFLFPFTSTSLKEKTHSENYIFKEKYRTADSWSREELKKANTAGNANYLSLEEKDMLIYLNLARIDGAKFFDTYFQDFVDERNQVMRQYSNYNDLKIDRNSSYYRSLRRDLQNIKNLPVFWPDEVLSQVATLHAKDLNRNNYIGHNSSDGRSSGERISRVYPRKANGECLAFGYNSGLDNICMLLLDKGVPDLGHRKLMLNTSAQLNTVGLSFHPHQRYKYCAVIDFVSLPN
ncbi:MAG: CAP domain-containing protein [Candidatus Pedobacter colombiensis]|uniref:CAP domain-containing protein n=1 Tax=Candidatus Pedobacter colombiensis TaxID=3121371 RepID=A0AAJ6B5X8_9SPHI|nr:CAP domain-containing protein [Pedobacter sp.]WEK18259.1 MAG: CAP domain-containing protein [Pedobacter sp.]